MTYTDAEELKPTDFKRFFGVKRHIFLTMAKALQRREQRKRKKVRDPDLSLEDRLLLALQYWHEYGSYFHPNRPSVGS